MTMSHRAVIAALTVLISAPLVGSDDAVANTGYLGLPLAEALEDLRNRGLRLIYSNIIVKPDMMVREQPEADTLEGILVELLASHGLRAHKSLGGIFAVMPAPYGVVFGDVRDAETDEPIRSAQVEILRLRSTYTDAAGQFELDRVPQGSYEIEARRAGYLIERLEATMPPGDRVEITFRLHPVSQTLEEMVVTPGQILMLEQRTAPEVFWTRDDVNRLPHLSDDLFRAISRLPGIARGDFSADFHIRGGERGETLVLIDGLQVYEPYHLRDFQNVFSIFDTNATDSVTVASGGFTSEYGDRMSGVVEISSVVPTGRQTMIGVSFEKIHFLNQGRVDKGDAEWLVNARRGYLDLLLDSVQSEDDDFNLRPVYYDLFGKVRWRLGQNSLLALSVLAASDDTEFSSDTDDDDLTSSYGNAYAWVKLDSTMGHLVSLTSVLSYGHLKTRRDGESGANLSDAFLESGSSRDITEVLDERSTDIAHFRQDFRFAPSDRHHLRSGLEVRWLAADYDYTSVNRVTDPVFTDQDVVTERRFDIQVEGRTYGAYFADRLRISKRVTAEAGLRWDRQSYVGDEQWSPRLNVVAKVRPSATLRASWGHYWQSQGIHELQVIDGVGDFHKAQLNRQATLAFEQHIGKGDRLSLQLYSKLLKDPRPRYENLFEAFDIFPEGQSDRVLVAPESGRSRGIELLYERRRPRIDWWISYALSEAEDKIDGRYVPRSWDQRHAVSYSVNLQLKEHWNLNLAGIHHTGWPATDVVLVSAPGAVTPSLIPEERNSSHYPDYHRFDFRASRNFDLASGELKIFFEVSNLLNRDNIRAVSDFEISVALEPEGAITIEREFEKWFPRLPSFGISWTF